MNKLYLFLIIFYVPFVVFTQNKTNEKTHNNKLSNEFGINLYSIVNKPNTYFTKYLFFNRNILPGVFYKKHFNRDIFRVSLNYYKTENDYSEFAVYKFERKFHTVLNEVEIKVGYERDLNSKKIIPFLASDFCYNYAKEKGFIPSSGYCGTPPIIFFSEEILFEKQYFAIYLGGGLKYKVSKKIVFTYESNLCFGLFKSENLLNSHSYTNQTFDMFYRLNPIQTLGISIKI